MVSDQLHTFLSELPPEITLAVMLEAMDILSYHNNQSHTKCVMEAIGAHAHSDNQWAYPTRDQVIKLYS